MSIAWGVLALAAIGASGCAATSVIAGAGAWRGAARLWRVGAAVLFGAGLSSAGFGVVLLTTGPRPGALGVKDALLIVCAAAVLWRARARAPAPAVGPAQGGRRGWWWLLGAVAGVVAAAWIVHVRAVPDADWDAWMIWNMRARFLARAPDDLARAFSSSLDFSHTDYPLFVPGLVTPAWLVLGSEPAWVPALVSNAVALACLCVVAGTLARLRDGASGAVAGITLLGVPFYASQGASQCSDVPVSAFVALSASVMAWAVAVEDGRRGPTWMLAGAAASLAAWTKNEGVLFFLAGAAAVFLASEHRSAHLGSRLQRAAWFVAGGLPALLLVWWFKSSFAVENDLFVNSTLDGVIARATDVDRYVQVAGRMAAEPFLFGKWNALPVVLAACVVLLRAGGRPSGAGLLGVWVGLVLAGFFAVYVLTPHDLDWHLTTSLDRLYVQVWPLAVLSGFLAMGDGLRLPWQSVTRPTPSFTCVDHL